MTTPPQNIPYEESIIATCLLGHANDVVGLLIPDDFYSPQLSRIYSVIQAMVDKNLPVDLVTVTAELSATGMIDKCGGAYRLSQIANDAPVAVSVEYYAEGIRKKAALRRLIAKCEAARTAAYDQNADVDEVLNSAQSEILSVQYQKSSSDTGCIRDMCLSLIEEISERRNSPNDINGIPCGFRHIDKTLHGFQPCDFILLAARPSMGKTALMLNMVQHACRSGVPTAVFSLEMSKKQLLYRIAAQMSGVKMTGLLTGKISVQDEIEAKNALDRLYSLPLFIDDKPGLSSIDLRRKLRKLHRDHGVKIAFIDYLQLMEAESKPTRDREVAGISAGIKNTAKDIGIPIIALSQLNRALETRPDHRPVLSDLRDSGTLEQDADVIMFLYRAAPYIKEQYDQNGKETDEFSKLKNHAEVNIAKHRNGATGVTGLVWLPEITSFGNKETFQNGGTN